ncbi:hypothetical protein [Flavobacterium sp.]|uniref:hypothetical protein n=1 Tax=Flavobacterium sp. TaxID=239 RepID=UPI002B4B6F82|nr:hypothetical protein [Flavobacterium sp.]
MLAEDIFTIASHLSRKEQERLHLMLSEKLNKIKFPKKKKKPLITDEEAIEYLYRTVFCRVK